MIKALILSAGFGKRLLPLTKTCPKPLLKIGQETLLSNTINFLKECGIKEVVINVHYLREKIIEYLTSEKYFDRKVLKLDDFDQKYQELIKSINKNAPVKIISQNQNEEKILLIFEEIMNEIKEIDLRKKIESLEDKVSLNLDEKLYSELLSLRNQLKGG